MVYGTKFNTMSRYKVSIDEAWTVNRIHLALSECTTSNYSTIDNSHTLTFTSRTKSSQSVVSSPVLCEGSISQLLISDSLPTTDRLELRSSRYSLCTDRTKTPFLCWWGVTWYHVLHCKGTVRLVPNSVATPPDLTAEENVMYSSVACKRGGRHMTW
jgi:hypothetical protein